MGRANAIWVIWSRWSRSNFGSRSGRVRRVLDSLGSSDNDVSWAIACAPRDSSRPLSGAGTECICSDVCDPLYVDVGRVVVADFVKVVLDDGTEVVFQSAESDLVRPHGGPPVVERYEAAMDALGAMAHATHRVARSFAERMKPDELALEIGVGLSGEVGWFFAKSELEATLTMTLTWKSDIPVAPGVAEASPSI